MTFTLHRMYLILWVVHMFHVYQKLPMFLIYIWCTWYDKKFIYYNCSECYHCSSRTWCTSVLNNVFITFFCQIVLIDLNHVLSVPDVTIVPGCLKTSMIRSHLVKKYTFLVYQMLWMFLLVLSQQLIWYQVSMFQLY